MKFQYFPHLFFLLNILKFAIMYYFNGICLFFRHFPSLKKLKPPYLTKYLADKMALFIFPGWSIFSPTKRCKLIIKLSQSIDFTAFSRHCMQSAPADKQYFYHYHILSFLCSKIMLCKRCKQGVKQTFHTQETAYLSHSWRYSQIHSHGTRIIF